MLNPTNFTNVSGVASLRTNCLLTAQGRVMCWGSNVGDGTNLVRANPVNVSNLVNAVGLAAGGGHSCAVSADGRVFCWGEGTQSQLGVAIANSTVPVEVPGLTNVVAVSTGFVSTCALKADGTVWCWGFNSDGQLGDGTFTSRLQPAQVPGLINVTSLSAGSFHVCVTIADGTARCWGANGYGTLGNGTTAGRTTPGTVSSLTNAVMISAGSAHTCALLVSSKMSCWGANVSGQLGSATASDSLIPTPVIERFTTVSGVTVPIQLAYGVWISASNLDASCAALSSGAVSCWGGNALGQLGNGTQINSLRPVRANSFTANVAPAGELRTKGRIAEVTILLNCTQGEHANVYLTLEQNQTFGQASAAVTCTGNFEEIPVMVAGHGPQGFLPGPATAKIEAIVRENNTITEAQKWTRIVQLAPKQ